MKLGRQPARRDPRTLRLARYLTPQMLADPPARVDWTAAMTNLGVMGNDVLGDCAEACPAHMIQGWTAQNGSQVIVPDAEVIQAYSDITGYVLGDESTDNGSNVLDVLNYWRSTGIGGHKILAYISVNPSNRRHVELAINLFGGVYAGLDLPLSARGKEVWTVPTMGLSGDGAPRSWGGHAVPFMNYGPLGVVCVTWGQLKTASWDFVTTYTEELYAVLSSDWANGKDGKSPSGFDLAALKADLAEVVA